jgi:hypothetical protein
VRFDGAVEPVLEPEERERWIANLPRRVGKTFENRKQRPSRSLVMGLVLARPRHSSELIEKASQASDLRPEGRLGIAKHAESFADGNERLEGRQLGELFLLQTGKGLLTGKSPPVVPHPAPSIGTSRFPEAQELPIQRGNGRGPHIPETKERTAKKTQRRVAPTGTIDEGKNQIDGGQIGLDGQREVVLQLVGYAGLAECLLRQVVVREGRGDHDRNSVERRKSLLGGARFHQPGYLGENFLAIAGDESRFSADSWFQENRADRSPRAVFHLERCGGEQAVDRIALGARFGHENVDRSVRNDRFQELELLGLDGLSAQDEDVAVGKRSALFDEGREDSRRVLETERREFRSITPQTFLEESRLGCHPLGAQIIGNVELFCGAREKIFQAVAGHPKLVAPRQDARRERLPWREGRCAFFLRRFLKRLFQ